MVLRRVWQATWKSKGPGQGQFSASGRPLQSGERQRARALGLAIARSAHCGPHCRSGPKVDRAPVRIGAMVFLGAHREAPETAYHPLPCASAYKDSPGYWVRDHCRLHGPGVAWRRRSEDQLAMVCSGGAGGYRPCRAGGPPGDESTHKNGPTPDNGQRAPVPYSREVAMGKRRNGGRRDRQTDGVELEGSPVVAAEVQM